MKSPLFGQRRMNSCLKHVSGRKSWYSFLEVREKVRSRCYVRKKTLFERGSRLIILYTKLRERLLLGLFTTLLLLTHPLGLECLTCFQSLEGLTLNQASEGSSLGQQLPILTLESGARFQSLRADSMASSLIIFLVSAQQLNSYSINSHLEING